ncbi:MAG: hypothetical protein HUJ63_03875, partial [Enterococcus sp.]|nr:hypothetical protein [Enterococcus sp.]
TIERAFADHVTVTGGNKFEKGNVDTFSIPIKKGVLVKEFAVSIWSLPARLDNPWCPDFISVRGQQRFHFSDANIKKGSTEDKRFWMNNKGDFALFETGVPLASKNSIEVLIHTMNITGAGTDSGFLFRLKYSNGQEKEYLDYDCVRSGVECYEQDDYDFFRIPLIPGERLKSITVEECRHNDKINAPWCPDWMQIDDGKQLNFCDAEHHKCDQTEDGIWMSNRYGASFTFNFNNW